MLCGDLRICDGACNYLYTAVVGHQSVGYWLLTLVTFFIYHGLGWPGHGWLMQADCSYYEVSTAAAAVDPFGATCRGVDVSVAMQHK